MDTICNHTFALPEYEDYLSDADDAKNHGWLLDETDPGVKNGYWHCPHEVVEGFDKCVFHIPLDERPPHIDATDVFLDKIKNLPTELNRRESRRQRQFIDTTFETFHLRGAVIGDDDREYIDMRHSNFFGVDCRRTEFVSPVRFAHSTFHTNTVDSGVTGRGVDADFDDGDTIRFTDVTFRCNIGFRGVSFAGTARFRGTTFDRLALFKHATFHGPSDFHTAQFNRVGSFRWTTFDDYTRFRATRWCGYARFEGAMFNGRTEFMVARFENGGSFRDARFTGPTSFSSVVSYRKLTLTGIRIEAATDFDEMRTTDHVDFSGAIVQSPLSFDDARVEGDLSLVDASLEAVVSLVASELDHLSICPQSVPEGIEYVCLESAHLGAGRLGQPPDGRVVYDCSHGTLGDVKFSDDSSTSPAAREPMDTTLTLSNWVRLTRTSYDGFDFNDADDLDLSTVGYKIHGLGEAATEEIPDGYQHNATIDDRWRTYLEAKNGANDVGDNVAAGAFYYREMRNRRQKHWCRAMDSDAPPLTRVHSATRWIRNGLLGIVTGYGEHPDRVLYSSVAVIVLFTGLYAVVLEQPTVGDGILGYLVLSLQSFVTFLLGDPPQQTPILGEVLSAIEGFLGAFLVALFVFTMTRRIRR